MATEVVQFEIGDRVCIRSDMAERFQRLIHLSWRGTRLDRLGPRALQGYEADQALARQDPGVVVGLDGGFAGRLVISINGFRYPSPISTHWFEPVPQEQ